MSTSNVELAAHTWTLIASAGQDFALYLLKPTQVYAELASMDTDTAPGPDLIGMPAHERRTTRTDTGAGYVFIRADRASLIAINLWS